ncbi:NusG domain II-containing protein [Candidatus Cetobacterium colombiensis]|uniref:NusG domain II-containing protein n=1 Tax=Candidatus Cetobacterium colombiensis TaxID=3073100 RepID=A0ABU4W9C2_9FUSO|nr:NusG domain II-containing protein [Candidatus Cetobacterium colombiensis]MDX8335304.1 NusG domain II-containing protein [Candidatus Cetobacterium colombiensis]
MKKQRRYFRKGDVIIYSIILTIFITLGFQITKFKSVDASSAEVYVNNQLKYVYPLEVQEKDIFVPTDIGGVNIKIKDKKIRVTTSNSPLKLNVKQGWISQPGEVIIGVPDRLIVKVVGQRKEEDVDFIIK